MGGFNVVPMPLGDPIARPIRPEFLDGKSDPRAGTMPDSWVKFLTAITQTQSQQPLRIKSITSTAQSASIATSNLSAALGSSGLYRVTWHDRVTTSAGVSSSIAVTIGWTDGGVPQTKAFAANAGNTNVSNDSGTWSFHADSASPITYATTYASNPAAAMQYRLDVWLEQIAA